MLNLTKLWNAMPRDVQRKISLHDLKRTVDAYNSAPETVPCPECAHDRPGEIWRCEGVYSLCPPCHGKGYLDGSESNGTTLQAAMVNLMTVRAGLDSENAFGMGREDQTPPYANA